MFLCVLMKEVWKLIWHLTTSTENNFKNCTNNGKRKKNTSCIHKYNMVFYLVNLYPVICQNMKVGVVWYCWLVPWVHANCYGADRLTMVEWSLSLTSSEECIKINKEMVPLLLKTLHTTLHHGFIWQSQVAYVLKLYESELPFTVRTKWHLSHSGHTQTFPHLFPQSPH